MEKLEIMGYEMVFLSTEQESVSGAIVKGEGYIPSDRGTLVYLNGGNDLNVYLSRVEKAGGKVVVPKTRINDDIGYFALFMDTEGNKVAFHSRK
ncbi:MAG: VOC family protein [Calditrichia bacterium]